MQRSLGKLQCNDNASRTIDHKQKVLWIYNWGIYLRLPKYCLTDRVAKGRPLAWRASVTMSAFRTSRPLKEEEDLVRVICSFTPVSLKLREENQVSRFPAMQASEDSVFASHFYLQQIMAFLSNLFSTSLGILREDLLLGVDRNSLCHRTRCWAAASPSYTTSCAYRLCLLNVQIDLCDCVQ